MNHKAQKDIEAGLGGDVESLKGALEELLGVLERIAVSEGTDAIRAARDKARDFLAKADAFADRLGHGSGDAKRVAAAARTQLEDSIRAQPLMAVGIAAAVGFLLASFGRR